MSAPPALFPTTETGWAKDALVSEDGRHRYWLTRIRQRPGFEPDPRWIVWVMLNPSTADASVDDPTIRRVLRFSDDWGFDRIAVVNLYAYRATNPAELATAVNPRGDNEWHIRYWFAKARCIVAAWGAGAEKVPHAPTNVLRIADEVHPEPMVALGTTKAGHPRHPLYVKADTVAEPLHALPFPECP